MLEQAIDAMTEAKTKLSFLAAVVVNNRENNLRYTDGLGLLLFDIADEMEKRQSGRTRRITKR